MAELPPILESYREAAESDPPRPMEGRFSDEHGDLAIGVIAAAVSGEPARFVLNVPNRGAIPGMPDDAVVELPCILRGRRVERVAQPPLPDMIAGLAAELAVHARLTAQAAVEGDRQVALQAMMSHPLVTSLPEGQAMLDELLAAHAAELSRFR
jgi:6-phospho-beta-glucosidase